MGEFAVRPSADAMELDIARFLRVCEAVFTTNFVESVEYGADGKIVGSELVLHVAGEKVVLSSGAFLRMPFQRTSRVELRYEPYY